MTKTVKRRLSATERRAKILSAAEVSFAENGFAAASMEKIASRAGVTKPVLYDHFASKQDLYAGVMSAIRQELLDRGYSAAASKDLPTALRDAIDAFFSFVEERPSGAYVFFVLPTTDPIAGRLAREVQLEAQTRISGLLKQQLPDLEPWRITLLTIFIQRGLHALAEWWSTNKAVDRAMIVSTLSSLLTKGLSGFTPSGLARLSGRVKSNAG